MTTSWRRARGSDGGVLNPLLLAALLRSCGGGTLPPLLERAQVALIAQESGGDSWAIHDDNSGVAYYPRTYAQAVATARTLVAHDRAIGGRGVDVGLTQIDDENFRRYNLSSATALDPCASIRASSAILAKTYADETRYVALETTDRAVISAVALDRTLEVYNSGRPEGDYQYTRDVLTQMSSRYVAIATGALAGEQPAQLSAAWRFVRLGGGDRATTVTRNSQRFAGDDADDVFSTPNGGHNG